MTLKLTDLAQHVGSDGTASVPVSSGSTVIGLGGPASVHGLLLHGLPPDPRRLPGSQFHLGRNRCYLVKEPGSRGVLKVRRGVILEIGIADARLTRSRQAARRFFRTFD